MTTLPFARPVSRYALVLQGGPIVLLEPVEIDLGQRTGRAGKGQCTEDGINCELVVLFEEEVLP